jgi:capsular polysaccharide biosynthesis protein/Mrp family chromosome partitioning ATPase
MLLRRVWIPLLCGAVVGGTAFFALSTFVPRSYEGLTYMRVNSGPVDQAILNLPGSQKPIMNVIGETAGEIIQYRVAERTVEYLQLKPFASPNDLLKAVDVKPDQQTGLIVISAKGRTAREAQRIANATARAYVDIRRAREKGRLIDARRELQRIEKTRVAEVRRAARATNGNVDTSGVQSIREQIESLQLAERINTDAVSIAKPAELPEGPAGIQPWMVGILGFVIGTALGAALIALRDQSDKRIHTRGQLERVLGAPVLASIKRRNILRSRNPLDALSRKDLEPFRLLFAKLRNQSGVENMETVVIASVEDDGSSGSVSWYLAATAAAAGTRVLLLETDHDRPSAVDNGNGNGNGNGRPAGLTDVLAARTSLDEVIFHVAADDRHAVDIVSPGVRNGGAHLGGGERVRELVAQARSAHDLVLIDAPPVTDADAVPFVRQAQGAVLVYRHGGADQEALRAARDELASVGTPLLGVVAVGFRG